MELLDYLRAVTGFAAEGWEDLDSLRETVLSDDFHNAWELCAGENSDVQKLMLDGAAINERISHRGVVRPYGEGLGNRLWQLHLEEDTVWMVRTFTATSLDFLYEMGGTGFMEMEECPVKGILATMPVIVDCTALGIVPEKKAEALVLSALVTGIICKGLHPRSYYGRLVAAAAGAAAGVVYLHRGSEQDSERAVSMLVSASISFPQEIDTRSPQWQETIVGLSGMAYLCALSAMARAGEDYMPVAEAREALAQIYLWDQ